MIHWAHIDANGFIVSWGTSVGSDVFLQRLAPGLTAVARPDNITGYDGARYVDGVWLKEEPQQ